MSVAVDGKALYQAAAFETDGLVGATAVGRLVGSTTSGAPSSGTFNTGDIVIDQSGNLQVCTAGGSPGTWAAPGGGITSIAGTANQVTVNPTTGAVVISLPVTIQGNSGSTFTVQSNNAALILGGVNVAAGTSTALQVGTSGQLTWTGLATTEQRAVDIGGPSLTIGGGFTSERFVLVGRPTITASSSQTVTNAASLAIFNSPLASGSAVITNPWALWVQNGTSRFDGLVDINQSIALGGGAAPTLGTIGGSGPATAGQNSWLKILIGGTASFIPIWR